MTQPTKSLIFGEFRLQMQDHPHGRAAIHSSLWRGKDQIRIEPKQLELLAYLAGDHPGESVTAQQIYESLWPHDRDLGGNVQQHISKLRGVLHDDRATPRYIRTLSKDDGYCFIAPVQVEGDLGRLDGLAKWSTSKYFKMLAGIEHVGESEFPEDLRMDAMGFPGILDVEFEPLLKRGVNIKVIITNQAHSATHNMIDDLPKGSAIRESYYMRQHTDLAEQGHVALFKNLASLKYPGKIEWRVSNAMLPGFLTHTHKWAVMGLLLANRSYLSGPMIEFPGNSQMWKTLYDDWKMRWDNALV
jgi:DNA-binding winged helix-turn-helix (wHTH) protein